MSAIDEREEDYGDLDDDDLDEFEEDEYTCECCGEYTDGSELCPDCEEEELAEDQRDTPEDDCND